MINRLFLLDPFLALLMEFLYALGSMHDRKIATLKGIFATAAACFGRHRAVVES